jgi:hypothetical protein
MTNHHLEPLKCQLFNTACAQLLERRTARERRAIQERFAREAADLGDGRSLETPLMIQQ